MSGFKDLDEGDQQPVTHQFLRQLSETCECAHFFTTLPQLTKQRISH